MREIKFRAWDKRDKRMYDCNSLARLHFNKGLPYCFYTENGFMLLKKDLGLMQFTGLHDKNGREIYERDILRIFDENYEVKVIQTETRMFVNYGYPEKHNGPAPDWVEVVGNIYENPELLKGVCKCQKV